MITSRELYAVTRTCAICQKPIGRHRYLENPDDPAELVHRECLAFLDEKQLAA